jgi:dihydroanticapsin dehydrogenase
MLTRALALELAPRRIRANCVCPGVVDTPLTELFLNRADDPAALREEYAKSSPLQRLADPREIANCVVFLASDDASFVTGVSLVADGGMLSS